MTSQSLPSSFTITANPDTDLWHKPPAHDVATAPTRTTKLPLSKFHRVAVTVSAAWTALYDQGGLVLVLPPTPAHNTPRRWVKAGIEFYHGAPSVSSVAADRYADWSLVPLPAAEGGKVRIQLERVLTGEDEHGETLRISARIGGEWVIVREVTWAFWELGEDAEIEVGALAARPNKDQKEGLVVEFSDFELE